MNIRATRLKTGFILATLLCCCTDAASAGAQSTPASAKHMATCSIDNSLPSDADKALFDDDYQRAETLEAAALKKNPADGRVHAAEIDALAGEEKYEDAQKEIDRWASSAPQDPFVFLAAGELRHAEGDWLESYAFMMKALRLDPCIGVGYAGMAVYEQAAGYRLTARKHFMLAHQLAPNDRGIELAWIAALAPSDRIQHLQEFLERAKDLPAREQKSLQMQLNRLKAGVEHRCEMKPAKEPVRIPMVPMYEEGRAGIASYGLEIAFNGKKRVLQIDTGASGFTLTRSAAGMLSLTTLGKSAVDGFGNEGGTDTLLQHADSVTIGGVEFGDCVVQTLAIGGVLGGGTHMGQRLDNIDGIVGSDIFNRYVVTLDYVRHEVRLDPLPQTMGAGAQPEPPGGAGPDWMEADRVVAPSMKSWTSIYNTGHLLIMPAHVSRDGQGGLPELFVLDTGAETNLITLQTAREITKTADSISAVRGLGGGAVRLSEAGNFVVDFAGLRLPVKSMDAINMVHSRGISGFLGYPTLSQLVMQIDYRDDLVHFEAPNAERR